MRLDYLSEHGITSPEVLRAMRSVPREQFVRADDVADAFANRPLPIGFGQTISQPYVVAYTLEKLSLRRGERVLDVGTGSGYQAALLAELGARVYGVEIIPELAARARETLDSLGYRDVAIRIANGRGGWPESGPYDAIVVAAATADVPPALIEQLAPEGRLILPLGGHDAQELVLVRKHADGSVSREHLLPVRFVPLVDEP